jgi:pimeloyl-ACP methyl ester carboxylesterase
MKAANVTAATETTPGTMVDSTTQGNSEGSNDAGSGGELHPPSLWLALGESRVMVEAARALANWVVDSKAKTAGGPVLVIPGLLATDASTWPLRHRLADRGFDVYPWELGVNRGPRPGVLRRLAARVRSIARRHGQPVQLVGWSLGGVLARVIANRTRAYVSRVVTLGSPLSGDPACSRLGPVFRAACGAIDARRLRRLLRESKTVPVTSIYSRIDGVVAWEASAEVGSAGKVIAVESTHLGLVVNPQVLDVVADELAPPATALAEDAAPGRAGVSSA